MKVLCVIYAPLVPKCQSIFPAKFQELVSGVWLTGLDSAKRTVSRVQHFLVSPR
ncbi:unnamed protein product, partial [Nesidiocoris tenuis]